LVQQNSLAAAPNDLFFIDSQTGWICGDSGKVIKTTNGGDTWTLYQTSTNYPLNTIKFIDPLTGWAAGGMPYNNPLSYVYNAVVKTTNGGVNWTTQFTTNSDGGIINTLAIANANSVFATCYGSDWTGMATSGFLFMTSNSGSNWFSTTMSGPGFTNVFFLNQQTGWSCAFSVTDVPPTYRMIYKTTNTGINWTRIYKDTIFTLFAMLNEIQMFDTSNGYMRSHLLNRTTNGGRNWSSVDSVNTYGANDICFINMNTGWVCKNPIKYTSNGGVNWINQSIPGNVNKLFFIDNKTGWAISSYPAKLLKTISGGMPVDTSAARYFPMAVGNVYTYYNTDLYTSSYSKGRITKDSVMLGHRYYQCIGIPGIATGDWVRYDSLSGLLLALSPGNGCGSNVNDKIVDSLSAKLNNSLNYCYYNAINMRNCNDTGNVTLFGNYTTKKKGFAHDGLIVADIKYAMNIGIISHGSGEPPPISYWSLLRGCKVNGVVYGDTNIYYTITGSVLYSDNSQPATGGYVKAIKLDRNTYNIITYDSAQIQANGTYTLTHVPADSVDIGVYPNSNTQNDWVMTYYPSTIYWQYATVIYPTGNMTNINIGAIRMAMNSNLNSVNGKVMSMNDASLANLKDAVLYAKSGNTFVRWGMSDGNGVYSLPFLATGSHKIICTRLGYRNDSTTVTVMSNSNLDSINFYLYKFISGIRQVENTLPTEYKLFQNYPNPFNPATNIRYSIPSNVNRQSSNVILKIYDLLGKEIATLVNEKQSPGTYEVTFDAGSLPSGIYFYTLTSGDFKGTKRFVLIK
jgi:photosystem II stability/assembly factor-like uncharacterized protein